MGCALLWTLTIAVAPAKTPEEMALKVGKRGEITLTQPTKVADRLLQPASYIVQHRTSGTDHFVRFVKTVMVETQSLQGGRQPDTYTESENVGEIKCRMEATADDTTAYIVPENGVPRITKIAIKGESALHIF